MPAHPWTTPADVKAHAEKLHRQGKLAALVMQGLAHDPVRVPLKKPSRQDLERDLGPVQAWVKALRRVPYLVVQDKTHKTRLMGEQTLPHAAEFPDACAAARTVGSDCVRQLERAARLAAATDEVAPLVAEWMRAHPTKVLAVADDWEGILAVHLWLRAHPRSGMYARQLTLPGVHSKFVERHARLLLDLKVEAGEQDEEATGAPLAQLGFRVKPQRVRIRPLGNKLPGLEALATADVTLEADALEALGVRVGRVVIVENEITYLSLPDLPDTVALFGAGYGADAVRGLTFVRDARVTYWGDLDTHGLAILDELRAVLPHAESVLMDLGALDRYRELATREPKQATRRPTRLTPDELAAYDALQDGTFGDQLRIEQERLPLPTWKPVSHH